MSEHECCGIEAGIREKYIAELEATIKAMQAEIIALRGKP